MNNNFLPYQLKKTNEDYNNLSTQLAQIAQHTGNGNGILTFQTVADFQTDYPNGLNVPVWIKDTSSWYFKDLSFVLGNIYVNQSGYDLNKPKRATIPNITDGTTFNVRNANDNSIAYTGTVTNQIADFTAFNPTGLTEYFLECSGNKSYNFSIEKYWMQKISINPALRFMDGSRQDTFDSSTTGIAWRDSHQFSFELNSLALQYMANPSAYDRMPHAISNISTCKFIELRTQNEPDIIWLMKFACLTYWDLVTNQGKTGLHALTKEQLAYFLFIYPEISQYVDSAFYTKIRDFAVAQWTNTACDSTLTWYDESTEDQNLLNTFTFIGGIKGDRPAGHSIIPNLMMYEVANRDGLINPTQYFNAAFNNCQYIVNSVDLTNPAYTKGQRMSEHITMETLSYFQEMYPSQAPTGLLTAISTWTTKMINRSNNLWDYRKYADTSAGDSLSRWTGSGTDTGGSSDYNEPGNIAGFMASAYAVKRVLTDQTQKDRLQQIAISQIDHMFGRNPLNRHFGYNAVTDFRGVDQGWSTWIHGVGDLDNVVGRIDGSPKENAYPYNSSDGAGYSEGWVAFNTAWNASLAYSAADDLDLKIYDSTFTNIASNVTAGTTIGIQLKAPLNFDSISAESGTVKIVDNAGNKINVTVTESSNDDYYLKATYSVPNGITYIDVYYGIGIFQKKVRVTVASSGDTTPPNNVTNLSATNVTQSGATLSWTASTSADIASYDIYNGPNFLGNATGTTFNVNGLSASTAYTLTVKAKDTSGNVATGSNVTFTTSAPADTTPPVITASPVGGSYTSTQTVTLSSNESATIYYTIDGSTPTYPVSGTTQTYSAPISIPATTTLKYIGRDTAGNVSAVQTQTYTISIGVTVYVSDSFNRANSTSSLGSTDNYNGGFARSWVADVGTWGITNNQAYETNASATGLAWVDSTHSDFSVSADITWQSNVGLIARYTDTSNYIFARIGTTDIKLFKVVAGTSTQIGSAYTFTPVAGTTYNLKLTLSGGNITVYKDGASIITATETFNQTATKAGLRNFNDTTSTFDNFQITQ